MTVYIGVDFHARQQTISYLTTEDGEIQRLQLDHGKPEEVRRFYGQFAGQRVVVGVREQWAGGLVRKHRGQACDLCDSPGTRPMLSGVRIAQIPILIFYPTIVRNIIKINHETRLDDLPSGSNCTSRRRRSCLAALGTPS